MNKPTTITEGFMALRNPIKHRKENRKVAAQWRDNSDRRNFSRRCRMKGRLKPRRLSNKARDALDQYAAMSYSAYENREFFRKKPRFPKRTKFRTLLDHAGELSRGDELIPRRFAIYAGRGVKSEIRKPHSRTSFYISTQAA